MSFQCYFYWISFINITHLNASSLRKTVSQWIVFLFSGTAGDSLNHHRGSAFSTKDRDNDRNSGQCAVSYKGGWWYNNCQHANLNGLYLKGSSSYSGVRWYYWKKDNESLKRSEMKIHPKDFWVLLSIIFQSIGNIFWWNENKLVKVVLRSLFVFFLLIDSQKILDEFLQLSKKNLHWDVRQRIRREVSRLSSTMVF